VVCAINGRPPSYPAVAAGANALLECWYPGQEGGTAMADVLFGAVNPGAKLPVTVARNAGQIPIFYNRKPSARRGYVFEDISPLFPFGFGLSYTSFEIGQPRLSAPQIGTAGPGGGQHHVRNTGTRAGDEVVQLYVTIRWPRHPPHQGAEGLRTRHFRARRKPRVRSPSAPMLSPCGI
jgi:beta-glucosidase